jgi:hypothetical protein
MPRVCLSDQFPVRGDFDKEPMERNRSEDRMQGVERVSTANRFYGRSNSSPSPLVNEAVVSILDLAMSLAHGIPSVYNKRVEQHIPLSTNYATGFNFAPFDMSPYSSAFMMSFYFKACIGQTGKQHTATSLLRTSLSQPCVTS